MLLSSPKTAAREQSLYLQKGVQKGDVLTAVFLLKPAGPPLGVRPGEVGAVCSSFAEAPGLRKARILSTSQQAVSAEQCRSWNPRMA